MHVTERIEPGTLNDLYELFRNPPPEYGPVDCWWWEAADLSKEHLRWQLEELKKAGVHGTWYYPRFNRDEPLCSNPAYWTEEWWEYFIFSLQEHRRLGLTAWMSDWTAFEFFQNQVRAERGDNPRLRGRRLMPYRMDVSNALALTIEVPAEEEILLAAAYRLTHDGMEYASQVDLRSSVTNNHLTWTAPGIGWTLIVVTAQPHDLDYLNPEVADRWLALHLGAFEARVSEFLGNTLEAYGPDEMYVLRGNILYSSALRDRFIAEHDYDPLPFLAGLFTDIGSNTEKIRCDYYDLMCAMIDESFYRRIADWLHARGMRYGTIATWGRMDPLLQTYHYGDFFRMLRHFDVTGNEDPDTGPIPGDVRDRKFIDGKFSSSIAHLSGRRKRTAVCAYWGSGWGATQQQNVTWTLANFAFGHNFYNGHGALCSTLGGWYEWVPPSIHFRQPYWQYWGAFTDWLCRLSCLMSQGSHVADLAIFYPLTTMHAGWSGDENFTPEAKEAAERVMSLAKAVFWNGIDFDYLDDQFLAEAEIVDGRLVIAGHAFKGVLLPPLTTIRRASLAKLRDFRASGGIVAAFGRFPTASPEYGRDDPELQRLIEDIFGTTLSGTDGKAYSPLIQDETRLSSVISAIIDREISLSDPCIIYSHRKVAGTGIVLLLNSTPEERRVTVTVRATGRAEIWDPFTGTRRTVPFSIAAGGTLTVELSMASFQGLVLAITPEGDDEGSLEETDPVGTIHDPVAVIPLDGLWTIRLQPTLDNRWGDFRYPPAQELIGPEARCFRYRNEDVDGRAAGWFQASFDDAGWEVAHYTHGPYWWHLGPFGEGYEPEQLLEHISGGSFSPETRCNLAGRSFTWEPIVYSRRYGSLDAMRRLQTFGGLEGIRDELFSFDRIQGNTTVVRYLFTTVISPEAGAWVIEVGGTAPFAREAWINGEKVMADSLELPVIAEQTHYQAMNVLPGSPAMVGTSSGPTCACVCLRQGVNNILLRIVQPRGELLNCYAALYQPSARPAATPRIPVLRWFREPQPLTFDIAPDRARSAGWYRFLAPPGMVSLQCRVFAGEIQAWVDGIPAAVQICDSLSGGEKEVILTPPHAPRASAQVAIRITHTPGCYAGAAFVTPVRFTCTVGEIPTGDWCASGLGSYSGVAIYSRRVSFDHDQLKDTILLEISKLATAGEVFVNGVSAGVGMAQPFVFDLSNLIVPGENTIEVHVANTLANHMSNYPTRFISPGQTESGLFGPVAIKCYPKA